MSDGNLLFGPRRQGPGPVPGFHRDGQRASGRLDHPAFSPTGLGEMAPLGGEPLWSGNRWWAIRGPLPAGWEQSPPPPHHEQLRARLEQLAGESETQPLELGELRTNPEGRGTVEYCSWLRALRVDGKALAYQVNADFIAALEEATGLGECYWRWHPRHRVIQLCQRDGQVVGICMPVIAGREGAG